MMSLILCALIGGGVGAAPGWFGKCSTGLCPLMANWRRGAFCGVMVGVVFYFVTGVGGSAAMNQSTPNVRRIGEAEFDAEVVHSSKPVVADFYATWCGPCKILSPRLDQLGWIVHQRNQIRQNQRGRSARLGSTIQYSGHSHAAIFQKWQGRGQHYGAARAG